MGILYDDHPSLAIPVRDSGALDTACDRNGRSVSRDKNKGSKLLAGPPPKGKCSAGRARDNQDRLSSPCGASSAYFKNQRNSLLQLPRRFHGNEVMDCWAHVGACFHSPVARRWTNISPFRINVSGRPVCSCVIRTRLRVHPQDRNGTLPETHRVLRNLVSQSPKYKNNLMNWVTS